jgi:hypothetical protein
MRFFVLYCRRIAYISQVFRTLILLQISLGVKPFKDEQMIDYVLGILKSKS